MREEGKERWHKSPTSRIKGSLFINTEILEILKRFLNPRDFTLGK